MGRLHDERFVGQDPHTVDALAVVVEHELAAVVLVDVAVDSVGEGDACDRSHAVKCIRAARNL